MTRNANLYVSNQLFRWLNWMATMQEDQTADSVAEEMLRNAILAQMPNIETVEADYWKVRKKLDDESVEKLKAVAVQ